MIRECPYCARAASSREGAGITRLSPRTSQATSRSSVLRAEGVNGQIELDGNRLRIRREGVVALLGHGLKGDKEILVERITAIQFREAGAIVNGYLQLSFMGGREAQGGAFEAALDENTVMFTATQEPGFRRLRRELEKRIGEGRQPQPSASGDAELDALERLASLRERGAITEEEFQAKKRRILGL